MASIERASEINALAAELLGHKVKVDYKLDGREVYSLGTWVSLSTTRRNDPPHFVGTAMFEIDWKIREIDIDDLINVQRVVDGE